MKFQTDQSLRSMKLSGHVGFDSLPNQLVNKSVQNGFVFNIMVGQYLFSAKKFNKKKNEKKSFDLVYRRDWPREEHLNGHIIQYKL